MTQSPSRVTVRKQVSDGNYGTEAVEVSMDAVPGLEAQVLEHVRDLVHAELLRSPSASVRRAVEPKALARPDVDDPEEIPF